MAMSRFLNLIIFFALLVLGACLAVLPAFAGPPVALAALPAFAASPPAEQTSGALWAFLAAMGVAGVGMVSALLAVFSQRAQTAPEVVGRFLQAILLLAIGAAAMLLAALPVFAGPPVVCALTADALARLEERFNERPFWAGIMGDGSSVLTLTASPDGSSWTALISATSGKSCIAAAGTMSSMPGPPADPVGEDG